MEIVQHVVGDVEILKEVTEMPGDNSLVVSKSFPLYADL